MIQFIVGAACGLIAGITIMGVLVIWRWHL